MAKKKDEEQQVEEHNAEETVTLTSEEVQTQAHETYADWWAQLKLFAMQHRETPTSLSKSLGNVLIEAIERIEAGRPA